MKVDLSKPDQAYKCQLHLRDAPMLLLVFLASEGWSMKQDIGSLVVDRAKLSEDEKSYYWKWDGIFESRIIARRFEDTAKLYARLFVSVFTDMFTCDYEVGLDAIVSLWNKCLNLDPPTSSRFRDRTRRMLRDFADLLVKAIPELEEHRVMGSGPDSRLLLFEKPRNQGSSLVSERSYSLSLNSFCLLSLLGESVRYAFIEEPDPNCRMFHIPDILDGCPSLAGEYECDLFKLVSSGHWPLAMTMTGFESAPRDYLAARSLTARKFRATMIDEMPSIFKASLDYAARLYTIAQ